MYSENLVNWKRKKSHSKFNYNNFYKWSNSYFLQNKIYSMVYIYYIYLE